MTSRQTPDRYLRADVIQAIARSRKLLSAIFGAFLLGGIALIILGGTIKLSIGTSIIASSLISLATLVIDQVRNGEQIRAADLAKAGMLTVYKRRDLPEYDSLIQRSSRIDVAGYTLRSFSESNAEYLSRRAADGNPVKVRVLLVDPSCEASRVMEAAEQMPPGSYDNSVATTIARLGSVKGAEIRFLPRHLSMMIYRIDGILYTGPFPQNGLSKVSLTFKLGHGGWLFQKQVEEFEGLWNDAKPISSSLRLQRSERDS